MSIKKGDRVQVKRNLYRSLPRNRPLGDAAFMRETPQGPYLVYLYAAKNLRGTVVEVFSVEQGHPPHKTWHAKVDTVGGIKTVRLTSIEVIE